MDANTIMALGLGVSPPWKLVEQRLDTTVQPHVLHLEVAVEHHRQRILECWTSTHSSARLEGFNGLFQAARARARGYRNTTTFATMIYLIAAPLEELFKSI